jgi:ABC-2 type transport system permease protein
VYGAWNGLGLYTLLKREVKRFIKVSAQTLVAPLMSTLLFMAVFSFAFSGRHWADTLVPYTDGLAPGLVMMAVLSNSFQNASSSMVIAKVQGMAVDFLMPPLSALELTIAFIGGAVARGLVVGFVSLLAVSWGANIVPQHPLVALYFAACAGITFGAIGLMGGIWAERMDNLATVTNFIIQPLTFLSGTFYSVGALPGGFSKILEWNPVFHMIDGFRYGFIGVAHSDLAVGALISGGLAAALSFACWRMLKSGYRLKA